MLWYNNFLLCKYENKNTIITPNYIKNLQNIINISNLSAILSDEADSQK